MEFSLFVLRKHNLSLQVLLVLICGRFVLGCTSEVSSNGKPLSAWIQQLKDPDLEKRIAAFRTIEELGPAASAALPELTRLALTEPTVARCNAIHALASVGRDEPATIPVLVGMIRDPSQDSRICAVAAIPRFKSAAVPGLAAALNDPDRNVREEAARELMNLGVEAKEAAPALEVAARDSDKRVAELANLALDRIRKGQGSAHQD